MLNDRKFPIRDKELEEYLTTKSLRLKTTTDGAVTYRHADFVIISTPTNYDPQKDYFDTSSVKSIMGQVLSVNDRAYIVIKSTVPVGFAKQMAERFATDRILFSPEFLREGHALYDNLYPSRIIMGTVSEDADVVKHARIFADLLQQGALKEEIDICLWSPQRRRLSSCLPIPIWRCGLRISMNWILTRL